MLRGETIRRTLRAACTAAFLLGASITAYAEYPRIVSLDNSDVLFRQIQSDISQFHRRRQTASGVPELSISRYELQEEDTFLRVASRLTLPHSTIASLNGLTRAEFPDDLEELLVPNQPGVFAPVTPSNDLEFLLSGRVPPEMLDLPQSGEGDTLTEWETPRDPDVSEEKTVREEGIETVIDTPEGRRRFLFFPGDDFTSTERRAFLGVLFRSPMQHFRISSRFGARASPFTGRTMFHTGIDLASVSGDPVRAVREGIVVETGSDPVYGEYVILEHDHVFTTFYGHLSDIRVESGAEVNGGTVIGSVGDSGLTTGPHLHFEVRVRGQARDPANFIPLQ
ncbi:MAG: M23 family metallopeptidase [Spirochaetota bacterium]